MEVNTTRRPQTQKELSVQMIDNAAFSIWECKKVADLKQWLEDDKTNQALLVFDTDVIVTNCAPWEDGPLSENGLNGTGQILPLKLTAYLSPDERNEIQAQEKKHAEFIAKLLAARALELSQQQGRALFQLQSHYRETVGVYKAVHQQAKYLSRSLGEQYVQEFDRSQLTLQLVLLRNLVEKAEADVKHAGSLGLQIAEKLSKRALSMDETVREWTNYYKLITSHKGIFHMGEYAQTISSEDVNEQNAVITELFQNITERHQQSSKDPSISSLSPLAKDFYQFTDGGARREKSAITDANALAELYDLNQNLKDKNIRVVLITASRGLVNVLNQPNERIDLKQLTHEEIKQFAENHVIHLWGFLNDIMGKEVRDVIGPQNRNTKPKDEISRKPPAIFKGLVATQYETTPESEAEILSPTLGKNILKNIDQLSKDDINMAYEDWESFIKNSFDVENHITQYIGEKNAESPIKKEIIKLVEKSLQDKKFEWSKLENQVAEALARIRDRVNVSFSGIGVDIILIAKESGTRNPPDLMFDHLENTNRILGKLASAKNYYEDIKVFGKEFDEIKKDTDQSQDNGADDDDRLECYLKYLVLGSVSASADHWNIAYEHAQNALKIIQRGQILNDPITRKPNNKIKLNGREAWYLLAVAQKVMAQNSHQIKITKKYLEEASRCLKNDETQYKKLSRNGEEGGYLKEAKIRLINENLSISISDYYLAREQDENEQRNQGVKIKDNYQNEEISFCDERVKVIYKDLITLQEEIKSNKTRSYNLSPLSQVQIAYNILQTGIIAAFRKYHNKDDLNCPLEKKDLIQALNEIYKHTNIINRIKEHTNNYKKYNGNLIGEMSDKIICTDHIFCYAIISSIVVNELDKFWYPDDTQKIGQILEAFRSVMKYDRWRFERLPDLASGLHKKNIDPNYSPRKSIK